MRRLACLLCLLLAAPALAVEPDEMLDDPALEARAEALDTQFRCVECRSESIASSRADWASDARVMVRELLSEGRTDAEVREFFLDRYGDFVLMRPRAQGATLLLWVAGPAMALLALGLAVVYIRSRRRAADPPAALDAAERARLEEILHR